MKHSYPEKVKSGKWWQYDPYMGAITKEKQTISSGKTKYGISLSLILRVGDTIPTGIVLYDD